MSLPREEVVAGTKGEIARVGELIRSLDDAAWQLSARREGGGVADIAKHVAGTQADIAAGRFVELAAPDATERQVRERKGRTRDEIADEIAAAAKIGIDLAETFDDSTWSGPPPVDIPGAMGEAV